MQETRKIFPSKGNEVDNNEAALPKKEYKRTKALEKARKVRKYGKKKRRIFKSENM